MSYVIPDGMVLIGTCGSCGGPVLSPQVWSDNGSAGHPPAQCAHCQRQAVEPKHPMYGPVKEMR